MKTILSLLVLLSTFASNAESANQPIVQCLHVDVIEDWNEEGEPIYKTYNWELKVKENSSTKYGYIAEMKDDNGATQTITDTDFNASIKKTDEVIEIAKTLLENFDAKKVTAISHANIGVDANLSDGAGINLFNLYDKSKSLIGQVGTVGWTHFKCH